MGWDGRKSLKGVILRAPLCGANNIVHRLRGPKLKKMIRDNLIKVEINFTAKGVGFCHQPFLGRELNLLSALKGSIVLQAGLRRTIILFTSCNIQQFN